MPLGSPLGWSLVIDWEQPWENVAQRLWPESRVQGASAVAVGLLCSSHSLNLRGMSPQWHFQEELVLAGLQLVARIQEKILSL